MLFIKKVRSPLRYPGGKSRAIKKILPLIPKDYKEFREPFVGGGSIFLAAKQEISEDALYVISDLNYDLYCFWKEAQENMDGLVKEIELIKESFKDGRKLYHKLIEIEKMTDFERAVRFFVLNRITFSGTVDSGGYSEDAFQNRFTKSSIERLKLLSKPLEGVNVYHGDYEDFVFQEGEDVFIFLDPPYLRQAKSKLYGKNGDLHVGFDHERFARNMKKCKHKWLITLDNTPEIWEMFSFAYIYEWELQYGMNNYKKKNAKKGKELFISNYKLDFDF